MREQSHGSARGASSTTFKELKDTQDSGQNREHSQERSEGPPITSQEAGLGCSVDANVRATTKTRHVPSVFTTWHWQGHEFPSILIDQAADVRERQLRSDWKRLAPSADC